MNLKSTMDLDRVGQGMLALGAGLIGRGLWGLRHQLLRGLPLELLLCAAAAAAGFFLLILIDYTFHHSIVSFFMVCGLAVWLVWTSPVFSFGLGAGAIWLVLFES